MHRGGPGDGQVVDRAVDGQIADVPTGEEQRRHHIGVRGEGQRRRADGERRRVFEGFELWVAKSIQEDRFDKRLAGLAACAVRERDELLPYPGARPPGPLDALEYQLFPAGVLGSGFGLHPRVPRVTVVAVVVRVLGHGLFGPVRPMLPGGVGMGHALLAPTWLASRTRSRLNRPKL